MENYRYISTYDTISKVDNIHIKYNNIYSVNGELTFVTLDKEIIPPYVNKWTNTHPWRPNIKLFDNENEMYDFFTNFEDVEIIELALLSDNIWYGNIGHALFDGFYPVYLAAAEFGITNEPFVYLADNWTNTKVIANEAIELFSGNKIRSYPKLDDNRLILFKTLIAGTGRTGNRVMNEEYTLYSGECDALNLFKKRILTSCDAAPDKEINQIIKIVIINNKRYSEKERKNINLVIEQLKKNPSIDIEFIDWAQIPSFKEQMKLIQDVDIHISGPGTGMMYMPFLKRGAVNINLGYMEKTQTNTARPNIKIPNTEIDDFILPGWMEQSVCSSSYWISTLYYDRSNYNNIEFEELLKEIEKAIEIVKSGNINKINHNTDALVFKEYCKRVSNSRQLCDHLTSIAFFIELFIYEHPKTIPNGLVDIELLRQIKKEFGIDEKYNISI